MDPLLTTERIVLRLWREDDAARLLDIHRRPEVIRWLDDNPVPMADLDAALARVARDRDRALPGTPLGFWAIEERAAGIVAGTALLCELPEVQDGAEPTRPDEGVEIGWYLHPDATGRGLAREAAAALLDAAFAHGFPAVNALMFVDNDPSAAVAQAIGLRERPVSHDRWYAGPSRHFALTAEEHAALSRP